VIFSAATSSAQNVLTRQNDIGRTGRQLDETVLTQANVTATNNSFGKVFTYSVTGQIYAQPLAVANIDITCSGNPHCNFAFPADVIYVATEDDWLYAFDATGVATSPYWSVNLATNAVANGTYVNCTQFFSHCVNTSAIYPHVGVTGTPVIDINTDTLYVVSAVSSTNNGVTTVSYYLHAIDLGSGSEKFNGPKLISASYPGAAQMPGACATGTGTGTVNFTALDQLQRPGLLLLGTADGLNTSVVYAGFSIYDGNPSFYGWVLGYDVNQNTQQLEQVAVFLTTPFGTGGGIWESGAGLAAAAAADGKTYIYVPTADGTFDVTNTTGPTTDYGDSLLKLSVSSSGGLTLPTGSGAYFTPSDQSTRCQNDIDFGSGGVMILPDASVTGHTNLMVSASKGTGGGQYLNPSLWVVDRDNLGGFQATGTPVEQAHTGVMINGNPVGGYWTSPAYYEWGTNNSSKAIYWTMTMPNTTGVAPNPLNQYILNLNSTNPPISLDVSGNAVPSFSTQNFFCAPVPTPSISTGPSNPGILWVVENSNTHNPRDCNPNFPNGAVLHAYDARNVSSTELYNSGSHINGNTPSKFLPPTVFKGRVYVGTYVGITLNGSTNGEVDVFGLCNGSCIP